jgi:hypothetical protein
MIVEDKHKEVNEGERKDTNSYVGKRDNDDGGEPRKKGKVEMQKGKRTEKAF